VSGMSQPAEAGNEPSRLSQATRQRAVTASHSARVLKKDLVRVRDG
jgi:hypothetical protein